MKDCTMKKTMIFAAFAALISLASCQKEDNIINGTDNQTSPVFTASIAGATKTTVDLTDGKVAWEADDEITITDASSASALYEIESIDETTGKATFVIKEGESAIGAGPYTATYGTEPSTSQTYSATAGKLYMTAATEDNSFTFDVQCGLMKLNLTKTGESVKSIAVTSSTDATYTLTCDPAQSIASAKDFCIALPAGSYTKIVITNATDDKGFLNSASGLAIEANHIKPVTLGASKINFTTGTAPATNNGVATNVKWIQLWKDGPKFAEFNVGAENNKPEDFGSYLAVSDLASKIPDLFGDNWRLPTLEDYEALLANCTYEYINGDVTGSKFTGKGDYSSNSIFLPIAGYMIGTNLQSTYYGFYWTSTPIDDGGRNRNYNHLQIGSLDAHIGNQAKTYKETVRLVLNEE